MYSILLAILFAAFAVLAWRDLRAALIALCALLPTYLLRVSIGPIPSTALEVLILIAGIVWITKHRGWKLDIVRSFGRLRSPMLLLLAAASFAVVVADDKMSALGYWKAFFIEPILVFVMLKTMFVERKDWTRALAVLTASAIVIALVTIAQRATGLGIPAPWDIELRTTSIFDFPNAVGLFLAPIAAALIVLLAKATTLAHRTKLAITMPIILTGVALAQTEAAFVAIPAALIGTLLVSPVARRAKFAVTCGTIVLGALLFATSTTVREKLLLHDLSGQVRRAQWSETLHVIADHPFLGTGLGGYPAALVPYHDNTLYEIFQYPHTLLFNIWVELGLLGVIAFIWLAIATLRIGYEKRRDPIALAAFAALLTMTIHGLADVPYFKNDLAILTWLFLALLTIPTEKNRTP